MDRATSRRLGEATATELFGSPRTTPGCAALLHEAVFGGIWQRPGLGSPDRLLCTIAALATVPRLAALREHFGAALKHGLDAAALREILLQAGLYAGFAVAEESLAALAETLRERNIPQPDDPTTDAAPEELAARGAALMLTLHGARAHLGYAAPDNPVTGALYPTAIHYGYGEIWFRPGLRHRQRALVAVAAFTALRLPEQVGKFGRAAVNLGLTPTEVIEAIVQTAPYSGFPPALNALAALGSDFAIS